MPCDREGLVDPGLHALQNAEQGESHADLKENQRLSCGRRPQRTVRTIAELLRKVGVACFQGYAMGKPDPPAEGLWAPQPPGIAPNSRTISGYVTRVACPI